jgi:hypothetical protein
MAKTLAEADAARKHAWYKPAKQTHGRSKLAGRVRHSEKFAAIHGQLLDDPSVAHSDWNKWNKHPPDVRPSSFPFCPRRYVFKKLGPKEEDDKFTVRGNFYTEIGKSLHAVTQNAWARTGHLFGYWTCARPTCGKLWSKSPSFLPASDKCKTCGCGLFNYHELELADNALGLVMHTDGILIYPNRQLIFEVKTAADSKVKYLKMQQPDVLEDLFATTAPWYGYWHQASTYASHAIRAFPEALTKLDRILFLIESRDDPNNYATVLVDVLDDIWLGIRADIVAAKYAAKKSILPIGLAKKATVIDKTPGCRWCDYKEFCLEKNGDDYVDVADDALFSSKAADRLAKVKANTLARQESDMQIEARVGGGLQE